MVLAIGLLPALRGTPRLLEHLTTVLGLSCYAGTTSSLLSASGSFCQIRLNLLQLGSMLTVRCGLHRWVVRVLMWWSVSSYRTTYTIDTTALIRTISLLAKMGAWIAKLPIRDSHSIGLTGSSICPTFPMIYLYWRIVAIAHEYKNASSTAYPDIHHLNIQHPHADSSLIHQHNIHHG